MLSVKIEDKFFADFLKSRFEHFSIFLFCWKLFFSFLSFGNLKFFFNFGLEKCKRFFSEKKETIQNPNIFFIRVNKKNKGLMPLEILAFRNEHFGWFLKICWEVKLFFFLCNICCSGAWYKMNKKNFYWIFKKLKHWEKNKNWNWWPLKKW